MDKVLLICTTPDDQDHITGTIGNCESMKKIGRCFQKLITNIRNYYSIFTRFGNNFFQRLSSERTLLMLSFAHVFLL